MLEISLTPIIITQPMSQAFFSNQPVTLSVAIAGTVPESYQWTFNGANIEGATSPVLTISNAQFGQAGTYAAIVGTEPNATTSASAVLSIRLDEAYLTSLLGAGGIVTLPDSLFVLTNTITLSNDLVLDGTGHSVTISGGGAVELFSLPAGISLTLRNLTFLNASVEGGGGAIFSEGFLNVENCQFTSNTATYQFGGAIFSSGVLTVSNSMFLGNSSAAASPGESAGGGAIFNDGGWLEVVDSVFTGNSAIGGPGNGSALCRDCGTRPAYSGSGSGGAIYSSGGTVIASNLLFGGNSVICPAPVVIGIYNSAQPATGGAVCIEAGNAVFENSIFSNNLAYVDPGFQYPAPAEGGSLYNAGSMVLSNCTILDSVANNGSLYANGGGTYNSGTMLLYGTVIAGNSVGSLAIPGVGGGIYNADLVQIIGCTFSNNMAAGGSGGGIANSGITSVSNTTMIGSGASGTNSVGIGIYNSGVFQCDSNSFLTGIPSGGPGISFQWEFNGTNIQGAVSSTFNLGTIPFASNGTYSLLVSNSDGAATNFAEIFNQPLTNAPTFFTQPASQSPIREQWLNFGLSNRCSCTGIPVGFEWHKHSWGDQYKFDTQAIEGSDAGTYWLLASNVCGVTASSNVLLVIKWPPIVEAAKSGCSSGRDCSIPGRRTAQG